MNLAIIRVAYIIQGHRPTDPVEQLQIQLLLEQLDLSADRRRRKAQLGGGGGETATPRRRLEHPQGVEGRL
jgi:hypothetical protein